MGIMCLGRLSGKKKKEKKKENREIKIQLFKNSPNEDFYRFYVHLYGIIFLENYSK